MKPSRILHADENGLYFGGVQTTYRPLHNAVRISGITTDINMGDGGFKEGAYLIVKHVIVAGLALLYVSDNKKAVYWANDHVRKQHYLSTSI